MCAASAPENTSPFAMTGTETACLTSRMMSQSALPAYICTRVRPLSLIHIYAAWAQDAKVDIDWIDAEELEKPDGERLLSGLDGIIVPGGFGLRGTEGMFIAAR